MSKTAFKPGTPQAEWPPEKKREEIIRILSGCCSEVEVKTATLDLRVLSAGLESELRYCSFAQEWDDYDLSEIQELKKRFSLALTLLRIVESIETCIKCGRSLPS